MEDQGNSQKHNQVIHQIQHHKSVVPTGRSSNFLVEDLLLIIGFESFLSLPGVINTDSIGIKNVSVRIYNKLDDLRLY